MRTAALASLLLLISVSVSAQVPAPAQSTTNFQIGSGAFGLGMGAQATPAANVTLSLNPGLATKTYLGQVSLISDNLLAPSVNLQYYGGGFSAPIPFKLTGALSGLSFFWRATGGIDRIVPATGPSVSHFGVMAGGGANWTSSTGVTVKLVEVDFLRTPGAPWGANAPAVSGGVGFIFGSH